MTSLPEVLSSALSALREPLFILNQSKECIFANHAFWAFLKRSPSDDLRTDQFWTTAADYKRFQDELTCEFTLPNEETFLVKLEVKSLNGGAGCHLFKVVSALSKSDPGMTFHSQRLETLGILAGAVAHDFNNILTGILGHATYLKTILPQAGPHVESLVAIEHGTRKGSSISQQILNFTKLESAAAVEPILLSEVIERTCSLLRRAIPPRISLVTDIRNAEVKVLCSESQLAQMLVNLVINARDAIETSGEIRVKLFRESDQAILAEVFKGLDLSATSYAVLEVADSGHGISEQLITKIFEPYFSTKKDKGTGLGLATVSSIVKFHGGAVTVSSEMGKGTSIAIYLPACGLPLSTVSETPISPSEESSYKGTEAILVVDDEYPVRNVLVVSLQHLGYQVVSAASGQEALEIFSKNPQAFDLIISDMLMPSMTGEQLFFELQKISPAVRVLIISGYSSEESVRSVLSNGAVGFIPKPFTIEELSKQVRSGLER